MEIKQKTFYDKIYDNWMTVSFTGVVTLVISFIIYGAIDADMQQKALFEKQKKHLKNKIAIIKKDKPAIICNKVLLQPNEYDLSSLNGKYYIVTNETYNKPIGSSMIEDCEIYKKHTKTMIIKPPVVIPIDVKHEKRVNGLINDLRTLEDINTELTDENKLYKESLETANADIKKLKRFIAHQDEELNRLVLIEAQHKQISGLMSIVLEKKNLKVKDLVVEPVKPKKKVVKIPTKIKKIKEHKVVVPPAVAIADNADKIKRLLYTIKYLTQKLGNTDKMVVPRPSEKTLSSIYVSKTQLDNFYSVSKQLISVVDRLTQTATRRFNLPDNVLRNSITKNVGI